MGFLNTDSMPRLVEKLADGDNIKITGNSKGNRVGTVVKKIVEKADDVTKAIEQEVINDSYSFKVGTGNVDVSADVEDGFGEVGIKGVTYQNVLPVGMFDSKENFYALGGQVSDLHSSFDGGYITLNATGDYGNAFVKLEKTLLKQNSKYTLILDIKNTTLTLKEEANPTTPSFAVASAHPSEAFVEWCFLGGNEYPLKNGIQKFLLTTKSDFTGVNWSTRMFISDKVASGSITFRFLLLEGDHTNNPNLPSYFEGIVGIGDKSKNLFNGKLQIGGISGGNGANEDIATRLRTDFIEISNTVISTKSYEENLDVRLYYFYNSQKQFIQSSASNDTDLYSVTAPSNTKYIRVVFANKDLNYNFSHSNYTNIQIQEGSAPTEYQPYGTHKIEILSCGKNLLNMDNILPTQGNRILPTKQGDKIILNNSSNTNMRSELRLSLCLEKGKTYYYSASENIISGARNGSFIVLTGTMQSIQGIALNNSFIFTGSTGRYEYLYVTESKSLQNIELTNLSIVESPTPTPYTPYVEDKTQILLDEPLMRLPNGVCDEITRDGKLIRRVGKVVVDSSSDIRILHEQELNKTAYCNIHWAFINEFSRKHNTPMISNITPYNPLWNCDIEGVNGDNETLSFRVEKSKLSELTSEAFREYLLPKNPVVYYQLANPIITELSAPYLRMFKDGHLTFNTLVAPESNHVVQLNKSAQIERSIREVQGLDSRVGQLESFYDDMMLETSHKLNLLTYDFEYTRERNGE